LHLLVDADTRRKKQLCISLRSALCNRRLTRYFVCFLSASFRVRLFIFMFGNTCCDER
jgi:hypothetical protein